MVGGCGASRRPRPSLIALEDGIDGKSPTASRRRHRCHNRCAPRATHGRPRCRACRLPHAPEDITDGLCADCAREGAEGASERERQITLARQRGEAHLGDDAIAAARANKAKKQALREKSRAARAVTEADDGS